MSEGVATAPRMAAVVSTEQRPRSQHCVPGAQALWSNPPAWGGMRSACFSSPHYRLRNSMKRNNSAMGFGREERSNHETSLTWMKLKVTEAPMVTSPVAHLPTNHWHL